MLQEKCINKRRIEASMAEAFITEEAANFVIAHYEAKNRHLHNPKPRYNADDPKKGGSNLSLFKGNLAPASVSNPVSLEVLGFLVYSSFFSIGGPFRCISSTT